MKTALKGKKLIIWVVLFALVAVFIMPADLTYGKLKNPKKKKGVKIELTGGDGKVYKPGDTIPLWALENATYHMIKCDKNRAWNTVTFTSNSKKPFSIVYQFNMGWGWSFPNLVVDQSNTKLMNKIQKDSWLKNYVPNGTGTYMYLRDMSDEIPVFILDSGTTWQELSERMIESNERHLTIGTQPTKKAGKKWKKNPQENYIFENFYKIDLTATSPK